MNLESIRSLLEVSLNFAHVMIEDDKYDIGFSNAITHPSPLHHYKIGAVLKILSEAGIQLIDISKAFDTQQEQQQQQLPPLYMGRIPNTNNRSRQNPKTIVLQKKKQPALPAPPSAPRAPRI